MIDDLQEISYTSLEWLRDRYKSVLKDFKYTDYYDEIFLEKFIIHENKRGLGHGSNFMNDLCFFADKNKKIITLIPSEELGTSIKTLESFYKRFGFRYCIETYNNHIMIRETI